MQLKSRFLFGLVVTMLVLAMAPTSFAQINIQLFPNGSAIEVQENRNALTNDRGSIGSGLVVSGSLLANSPLTSTTLTITYPGPITSDGVATLADGGPVTGTGDIPAADPLRLEGRTGVFAAASIITVNFTGGQVLLGLPGFDAATNTLSGSFRLVGVRVDASGLTAPVTFTASLSNTANNYLLSTTSGTVITALDGGIESLAVGSRSGVVNLGSSTIFTNAIVGDSTASIVITEGFASAWKTATQESNSGTPLAGSGTSVELTFTGIPSGVTLTLSSPSASTTLTGIAFSDASLTSASGDNDSIISFTSTSLTTVESVQVDIAVAVSGTTTSVPAGTVTVNARLSPVGNALSALNVPIATPYPRFAAAPTSDVTVVNIISAATNLLVPFAVSDGGFDTGIAIANTTADPFSGIGGATPAGGTITVTFFPRTASGAGTSFSLTTGTGTTPGIGLSTDGTLAAGGTWSALLSELLTTAGQSGSFTGYLFIQTNFILAHGTSFVTDFTSFTSASPVLVVPQTQTAARTGFESLGM